MHVVPPADGSRLVVVGRRDDDQIVEERQVFGQRRGEEIAVADADRDGFDSHRFDRLTAGQSEHIV